MDLKQIMTGKNPQSLVLEQTRGLKSKWEKTGLLEGVGSETQKHGMAAVLKTAEVKASVGSNPTLSASYKYSKVFVTNGYTNKRTN